MARTNRHFSENRGTSVLLHLSLLLTRNHTIFLQKCQYNYNLFLMILPLMVLGSSLRNSTIRGYL